MSSLHSGRLRDGVERMDELEFRRFVAARGSALCRSAYLLTGDWQLGEDLVQTALAQTWSRRWRLRDPQALESYVHRCMIRASITWYRRRSSREMPIDRPPERSDADSTDSFLEREQMWRALKQLPARQRGVGAALLRGHVRESGRGRSRLQHRDGEIACLARIEDTPGAQRDMGSR